MKPKSTLGTESSEESRTSLPTWESSANSDVQDSLGLGLDEQNVQAFAASKFGARELRSMIFKGGRFDYFGKDFSADKKESCQERRIVGCYKSCISCAALLAAKKVKGSSGNQIQDSHDKISDKFQCMAHHKGFHRFCFTNKSPYHEIIDFDVHVGHFAYYDHHANCKGQLYEHTMCNSFLSVVNVSAEHINPLLEQIGKLGEALSNIQFEQHWPEAQTEHQAIEEMELRHSEPSRILTRLSGEELPRKTCFVRLKQPHNVHLKNI
ncbi:hypothetical protein NL676_008835 [Syzygium grande]|nr:hypothetical protein NL676_008835 [Syzygium grande]